ncbi:MAG: hypothetical protein L6R37_008425, partial [Teloschistes peruensis]
MKQTEIEGAVNKTDEQLIVLENKFKEFHLSNNGQDAAESTESIGSKAEVLQQLEEERKVPSVSQKVLDELLSKSKEEAIAKAAAENQRHSATVTFGNQNSGFQAGSINGPITKGNVSQTQKAFPVKRGTSTANGFPIGLCAFSNSHLVTTPPQTAIHLSQGTDDLVVAAPSQDIKEGQNYGVKVLHNGGSGACVDIVFVHGLTGKAYNTWLHKETGIHWPSELLRQDIPKSRILSFGYDADVVHIFRGGPASNSRLSNHAESLVGKLVRARERSETETRKIIFVARSLGGLVTEQALARSKNSAEQHLHQVELHTIGIVFLEVPHSGTDLEAWATVGRRMASILKRTNKDILGVLNPDSEMLHMVENNFHTNLRQRKDDPIEIVGFYEELPVKGIGEIVPQHSAKIAGYNFYGIHADHTRKRPGLVLVLRYHFRETMTSSIETCLRRYAHGALNQLLEWHWMVWEAS